MSMETSEDKYCTYNTTEKYYKEKDFKFIDNPPI